MGAVLAILRVLQQRKIFSCHVSSASVQFHPITPGHVKIIPNNSFPVTLVCLHPLTLCL